MDKGCFVDNGTASNIDYMAARFHGIKDFSVHAMPGLLGEWGTDNEIIRPSGRFAHVGIAVNTFKTFRNAGIGVDTSHMQAKLGECFADRASNASDAVDNRVGFFDGCARCMPPFMVALLRFQKTALFGM